MSDAQDVGPQEEESLVKESQHGVWAVSGADELSPFRDFPQILLLRDFAVNWEASSIRFEILKIQWVGQSTCDDIL